MKNVLITGISGFVGMNLVNYFKDHPSISLKGYSRKKIDGVEYLPDVTARTLDDRRIDTVVHLAGIAHDIRGKFKVEDYYRVNTDGTKALVDEILKSKVKKFIYVSSIKAACDRSSSPVDESVHPVPVTAYGKSKLKAEEYIQSKAWEEKTYYILRPGMMHGQGNKGNLNLLYKLVKAGVPFPFGAFHNQRSFLGIDNFCFVVEQLLMKTVFSGVYHLADDHFLSTIELYQLIATTLNRQVKLWNIPRPWLERAALLVGKKSMLSKLTEDMMISNKKIIAAINVPLPVSLRSGLIKTIRSFDAQ